MLQRSLGNRELLVPMGRLLGGSGALNGMNFVISAKEDLDGWAALGNQGWDWESFEKYLKKTYTLTAGSKTENDGVLHVNIPDEEDKWPSVWRDTFATLGFPTDNDPFSGEIHGAVMYPDAIHPATKTRSFAGNGYLGPARDRSNLTIRTGVSVEKVLFDQAADSAVATGVQYTDKEGKTATVSAGKEVILSAGTFHSPKILELSGIGDAKLLGSLGIDVVVDNPHVGENLQNHPMCVMVFETADDGEDGFETIDPIARQDPAALGAAMEAYTTKQRGPFSKSNSNAMAHIPFPDIDTTHGKQEVERLLETHCLSSAGSESKTTTAYAKAHETLVRNVLTSPKHASGYYLNFPGWAYYGPTGRLMPVSADGSEKYFSIALILTHPLSRGSVHLTSQGELAIDPNYLSHPLDTEVLARHVRFLESKLATAEPLASRLKLDGKRAPAGYPRGFTADLDKTKEFVRDNAVGAMHYTSTCSMMPREMGGVVDSQLRVYGTKNLRVVDASIMPYTTRANTMATVYGIAEKAADIIKAGL